MLVVMRADGNDQPVDELARAAHNVDMAEGDGVEAAGIKPNAHGGTPGATAGMPGRVGNLLAAPIGHRQEQIGRLILYKPSRRGARRGRRD